MLSTQIKRTKSYGKKTATAGTLIQYLLRPWANLYTHIMSVAYTTGSTPHTLTVARPCSFTTLAAAAAAAQAVVVLNADPGVYSLNSNNKSSQIADLPIAAGHYLAFETPNGNFYFDTVSTVSGLSITMTNNLPTAGLAKGARVWFFGLLTSSNPQDDAAHPTYSLVASQTNVVIGNAFGAPMATSLNRYEPMIVSDNNATAAGTIEGITTVGSTA